MMITDEEQISPRIFTCSQCPKLFATRSNLYASRKRHMENPNIHNIPYIRSRDQKRWKGHSKKVVSKEETTERMRRWRAENREKNRQNDLRCRVYRLARQKFGEHDSLEKQNFVRDEIARRLGRRMLMEKKPHTNDWSRLVETPPPSPSVLLSPVSSSDLEELPFYSVPQQKIELPSIDLFTRSPKESSPSSPIPHLSPSLQRRTSNSSTTSSCCSSNSNSFPDMNLIHQKQVLVAEVEENVEKVRRSSYASTTEVDELCVLPSMHTFLSYASSAANKEHTMPEITTKGGIKYVESNKILDEFVGVVLNYANHNIAAAQ